MSWFQKSKLCMHIAICAAAENQPEKNSSAAEFFFLADFRLAEFFSADFRRLQIFRRWRPNSAAEGSSFGKVLELLLARMGKVTGHWHTAFFLFSHTMPAGLHDLRYKRKCRN